MIHTWIKTLVNSKTAILFLGMFLLFFIAYIVPTEPDVIIEMTKSGFVPKEVTIKQGQTVRFLNTDDLTHWPATHAHPTHTLYPDSDIRNCGTPQELVMFDSCRPVEPGGSYDFTFTGEGTWGFHDHIISRFTGRVYVDPVEGYRSSYKEVVSKVIASSWSIISGALHLASNPATLGLEFTRGSNYQKEGKYDPQELASDKDYEALEIMPLTYDDLEISRVVYQIGVKRTLEKLAEESRNINNDICHIEAHYVGRAAYNLFGTEAFSKCTLDCHSGCYHGIMETLFSDKGSAEVLSTVKKTCASLPTVFGRYQCFHGVGHGVLSLNQYNLVNALDTCVDLGSPEAKDACYGGVFMENVNANLGESLGNEGHVTAWLSWDDLFFPCNTELNGDSDARQWCYDSQASWLRIALNNDRESLIPECLKAPEDMIPFCLKSVSRNESYRDPEITENLCAKVPEKYYEECILSASKVVVDYFGPSYDSGANDFCAGLSKDEARNICYGRFIKSVPDFFATAEERRSMCQTMNSPYQEECINYIEGL